METITIINSERYWALTVFQTCLQGSLCRQPHHPHEVAIMITSSSMRNLRLRTTQPARGKDGVWTTSSTKAFHGRWEEKQKRPDEHVRYSKLPCWEKHGLVVSSGCREQKVCSRFSLLLPLWPWASLLTSLCLLICKTGILVFNPLPGI